MMIKQIDCFVTALVPCYNEESRIGQVLSVLTSSKHINSVIVVNDGSTDNSLEVINNYPKAQVISLPKNSGKGEAIACGLEHVYTPIVFLCDADIYGLTDDHVRNLVNPVIMAECSLCVGVRKRFGNIGQFFLRQVLPLIAGERVLKTEDLKSIVKLTEAKGWGIEPLINFYFRKRRLKVKKIDLSGVMDIKQYKKRGIKVYVFRLIDYVRIYINTILLYLKLDKQPV